MRILAAFALPLLAWLFAVACEPVYLDAVVGQRMATVDRRCARGGRS